MSIVSHTGGRFVPPTRTRTDHPLAACTLPPAMTARPRLMARSPAASRQALSRVAVLWYAQMRGRSAPLARKEVPRWISLHSRRCSHEPWQPGACRKTCSIPSIPQYALCSGAACSKPRRSPPRPRSGGVYRQCPHRQGRRVYRRLPADQGRKVYRRLPVGQGRRVYRRLPADQGRRVYRRCPHRQGRGQQPRSANHCPLSAALPSRARRRRRRVGWTYPTISPTGTRRYGWRCGSRQKRWRRCAPRPTLKSIGCS